MPGCSGSGKSGWDYCVAIKVTWIHRVAMERRATACAKAIATRIPIVLADSPVSNETGTNLFPDVQVSGLRNGIIAQILKRKPWIHRVAMERRATACAKAIATRIPDCKAGLKCFQREFLEPVPGCSGLGAIKWDYCVDEKFVVDKKDNLGSKAYGLCEGDCDKDSDCSSGLTCFQRDGDEPIPGCFGSGKKGSDYCVAVKPLDSSRNGGTGYGMCEGDCDYDSGL